MSMSPVDEQAELREEPIELKELKEEPMEGNEKKRKAVQVVMNQIRSTKCTVL